MSEDVIVSLMLRDHVLLKKSRSQLFVDTVFVCAYNVDMAKKKRKNYWPKRRLWQVVAVLAVLAIAYLLFRQVAMRLQKAEFKRAEAYVQETADNIEAATGKPHERLDENSCYYASRKFSRGDRLCVVRTSLIYRDVSVDDANRLLKKAVATSDGKLRGGGPNDMTHYDTANNIQSMDQEIEEHPSDYCFRNFTYNGERIDSGPGRNSFVVKVICRGGALAEYYPVLN